MQSILERYGMGIVAGSVVTVGLLFLMQAAISNEQVSLNDPPEFELVEFVRLLEDVEPVRKPPKVKPPPPPEEFPPDIPPTELDPTGPTGWTPFEYDQHDPDTGVSGVGEYVQDGEYLPIVKVNPQYPRKASQRGIEGWVIVEFTVTESGSVVDAFVHSSDPPGIFDRAAVNAALKFKYKPRVVDGQPIRVSGVKNRIVFELED